MSSKINIIEDMHEVMQGKAISPLFVDDRKKHLTYEEMKTLVHRLEHEREWLLDCVAEGHWAEPSDDAYDAEDLKERLEVVMKKEVDDLIAGEGK